MDCTKCKSWCNIYKNCSMRVETFKHYMCVEGGGISRKDFAAAVCERAERGANRLHKEALRIIAAVGKMEPVNAQKGRQLESDIASVRNDLARNWLNFTDYKFGKFQEFARLDALILGCFGGLQKWESIMACARPTAKGSVSDRRWIEGKIMEDIGALRDHIGDMIRAAKASGGAQ